MNWTFNKIVLAKVLAIEINNNWYIRVFRFYSKYISYLHIVCNFKNLLNIFKSLKLSLRDADIVNLFTLLVGWKINLYFNTEQC